MSPLKLDDFSHQFGACWVVMEVILFGERTGSLLEGQTSSTNSRPILYHVSDGKYDAESGDESAAEMAIYGDINDLEHGTVGDLSLTCGFC